MGVADDRLLEYKKCDGWGKAAGCWSELRGAVLGGFQQWKVWGVPGKLVIVESLAAFQSPVVERFRCIVLL